jgi:ECF transporter S component (folate family)
MKNIRVIVFMGLFIALEIILTRFLSIQTPIVRIGFGFLPIALSGIMFGPMVGGVTAVLADLIRMAVFPSGYPYFPGYTLSAFLGGAIYGLFLYKKSVTVLRVGLAVLVIKLFVDLGLNTVWTSMLQGKAILVILPTRLVTNAIMFPIQTLLIFVVWRALGTVFQKQAVSRS